MLKAYSSHLPLSLEMCTHPQEEEVNSDDVSVYDEAPVVRV